MDDVDRRLRLEALFSEHAAAVRAYARRRVAKGAAGDYDHRHHAYVVSIGAPGPCSFVEFTGDQVIARMSQAQFRRAAHTSFIANCELHQDPAGGVLVSACAGSLGSETSWSVNVVSKRASLLGYGYAAASDGHHVALVQHTYFPPPGLGSAELLAAGRRADHRSLHLIVPLSDRYAYTDPALSLKGERFAAVRTSSVNSSLVVGRLGGQLRPLRRFSNDTSIYDLQWLDSGTDLVWLGGRGLGPSGTLSLIDRRNGRERTLATAVTSFAVAP
jgi:hypothetical protein